MASSRHASIGRSAPTGSVFEPTPFVQNGSPHPASPGVPGSRSRPAAPYWGLDALGGRFVEISSAGQAVSITAAASLILEAQLRGEPAAWVAVGNSTFFPPDFAKSGIDLGALPVMRVPTTAAASRAADQLLRSGGFGVMVLDLGRNIDMRVSVQVRLATLARKHHTALLCLTHKKPAVPSLGPLVSLRAQGTIKKTGFDRFTWELQILRDKRSGSGWRHSEVCHGPDGLC